MESSQLYYQWFGIPAKDQPPNAYRLLGAELFEPNPAVLEAAAEQRMLLLRARQYGPQGAQAQRLMNEVSQALRTLLNVADRAEYDANLRVEIARHNRSNSEAPLFAAQLGHGGIAPAGNAPALSIRPESRLHRPRPAKSLNPVWLWAGIGGGALIALVVLIVIATSGGTPAGATAERPEKPAPKTPASVPPRRITTAKPPALQAASEESSEFQFKPQVINEPPAEPSDTVEQAAEQVAAAEASPAEVPEKPATNEVVESDPQPETAAEESSPPAVAEQTGERRVLRPEDFQFVGAFKLPQKACGQSTGYAAGCLALRIVDKQPRLFSDSHVSTGGAVYEVEVPAPAKDEPYPTASIVREWGDIYQGHKQKANGESYPLDGEVPTTGLRWDEAEQKLWWTYGQKYNTENQDAPTFGATRFNGETLVAEGPWRLSIAQSWQRGGTLEIPAWFADKYAKGYRLGVGFGGYYSIFEGGSYGPTLSAVSKPVEGKSPGFVTLLAYPIKHECVRDANYHHVAKNWMGKDPVGERGTWNATDEIGGEICSAGAIWIDAPDKHGLLFFASLGTGRLAYEDGGVQAAGREDALFIYDPADLAKAAQKKADPWSATPKFYPWKNPAPGMTGRVAGVSYDAGSRKLYVVFINAYVDGEEAYPLVVVYRL